MCCVSFAPVVKLGKGNNITANVLLRICTALECDISDIMKVVEHDVLDYTGIMVFLLK